VRRFWKGQGCPLQKSRRQSNGNLALIGEKVAFFDYFLCGGKESKSPKAKAFGAEANAA
jgi:hypothetical protein